jgi:hypothetical protein
MYVYIWASYEIYANDLLHAKAFTVMAKARLTGGSITSVQYNTI